MYVPEGSPTKLPTPTSLGFEAPAGQSFAGWKIGGETGLFKAGSKYTFDSPKRVTAIWADTIRVIYDPNGGTPSVKKGQEAPKGIDTTLFPLKILGYSYTGYEFKGWDLSPGSSKPKYTDGQTVKGGFSGETTLYAIWEKHDFTGKVTITGEQSGSSTAAYAGETLEATVSGEKVFHEFTYQWKANGEAIPGATKATYKVKADDFGKVITCEVTATEALDKKTATSNAKIVSIDESEKRIVNNGQVEIDYIEGLTADMTYSLNNSPKNPVKLVDGAMPVDKQGTYRFYKGNALVGTVEVVNWYTVGYVMSTGTTSSTSDGTTASGGSGLVTAKSGDRTLTASTIILDSAGETILQPYTSVNQYDHVWIIREGSGLGFSLDVRPSAGSYRHVRVNNSSSYDSGSTEKIYMTSPVNTWMLYEVIFNRSNSSPRTGDESQLGLWSALCFASLAGAGVLLTGERKRRKADRKG